ncbi:EAL domain-containing protein [Psychromonas sp. MME2]|uniref:bifunctional diguanylate cyclase/phosphodiesterase n=1 Tax=Psychromonas sp. MME2 TaxID=3231033 RepID=UPI00339C2128
MIAVVVAVLSLDWWSQQLSEEQLPKESVAFITDKEGHIVANFPIDIQRHGQQADSYGLKPLPTMGNELQSNVVTGKDGISRIYIQENFYTTDEGENITLNIAIPLDKVGNEAALSLLTNLLIFFTLLALVSFVAFRDLTNNVRKPLQLLYEATVKLKRGQYSPIHQDIALQELAMLAKNFDKMAKERLNAEKNANQKNQELDSIFNALPDLYFKISDDDTIIDYRASTLDDLYLPPEKFLGQKMTEVIPDYAALLYRQNITELRQKQQIITWEYSLEINGSLVFFEARANTINNSTDVILVIRNITRRVHNEKTLQLAASVFENSSECMVVTDANGKILNVNPSFTAVTGYSRDEVLGHTPNIFASGLHDVTFYEKIWASLQLKGHWEGEIYNKTKHNEILTEWVSINAIYDSNNEIIKYVALYRDISEQKHANQLIWHQANFDHLTDLPNRNSLVEHLNLEIIKARRNQTYIATLFVDLDEFKQVNDTLGHDKGDILLKLVSKRLLSKVRADDFVARQSGDEFIVILGNLKQTNAALQVVEQLLRGFNEPYNIAGEAIYISASIGISYFPQDGQSSADLLKTSDQAMYAAKALGKNCSHCFTQAMQDAAVNRTRLIKELHVALELKQFQLYFQPIISLTTGKIVKAEALIRWNHPSKGVIAPIEFIAIAEETKFINQIGEWIFTDACAALSKFKSIFGDEFQLSINVSPVQLSAASKSLQQWADKLHEVGISPSSLVIEITEGVLMSTTEESLALLLSFRDVGIELALDDFGTGYSSLTYIREYDVDYLKIDREFVRNLADSLDSKIICESIIVMAHKLGIKVIAEGIKTEKQKELLIKMGCDLGQGYLFSRPVCYDDFIALEAK